MSKKVLVEISGGIDSSVASLLLLENGYDVSGITFKAFENESFSIDAKSVCKILGIKHFVIDVSSYFKKEIIDYFIREYSRGRTPNPCVMCNKKVKFGIVLKKAIDLGFDYVSTGHYVQIVKMKDKFFVKRNQSKKDQSYYFSCLNQYQLRHILTPLSNLSKNDVFQIANKNGLIINNKESQDICFIKDNYRDFLNNSKVESKCGIFVDEFGNILGKHNGIINYTVGQRRNLNISVGTRLYVKNIDHISNKIVLSEKFLVKRILVKNVNFIFLEKLIYPIKAKICTRYNCTPSFGIIFPINKTNVTIDFETPVKFASPGQLAVFYIEDLLIGGGIISNIL